MNRLAFIVGKAVLPPFGWAVCAATGNAGVAWTESKNKLFIIETVEFAGQFLGGGDLEVEEHARRVYAAEPFRALWLAEGVGLHYGMKAIAATETPKNLLNEGPAERLPRKILLVVHAGMSMAFVRHFLDRMKGRTPSAAEIGQAAERIFPLLKDNSRQGYLGMSFEALGMVIRFFYGREMLLAMLKELARLEPGYVPQFWHGAGRALYFVNFAPTIGEPWPAFRLIEKEALDSVSRANLMAGLASAMMMVNMNTPQVMESIIRSRVAKFSQEDKDSFANGVICSTIIRNETTPGEKYMQQFPQHKPKADVEALWNQVVRQPVEAALHTYHPALQEKHYIDEVCYCQPMGPLMERLATVPARA